MMKTSGASSLDSAIDEILDGLIAECEARFGSKVSDVDLDAPPTPWREWLLTNFPNVASKPLATRMERLWGWFEAIRLGVSQVARVEIWGRGGAKSASGELGTAYVGEHLLRRFVLYVSETQPMADSHVQNVAAWLQQRGIQPALTDVGPKRALSWSRKELRTANGFNVAGFGLAGGVRGIRIEDARPDLIIFDDVDNRFDTPSTVRKKLEVITQTILPSGSPDCIVLFLQNKVHANSIASQLADERADFLLDRDVACVEPAIRDLQYELVPREGRRPLYKIVGGTPTWAGQDIDVCQYQMNLWGLEAFLRESQHEVRGGHTFFDTFDVLRHATEYSPWTPENPPPKWWKYFGGVDWGYAAPWAFVLIGVDEHGKKHVIQSDQDVRLTDEQQATRIVALLKRWGIDPQRCSIGYDETMQNREHPNGIAAEAPIEFYYRAGLRCIAVDNDQKQQSHGFGVIREMMRIPGTPSTAFHVWPGFNADLVHALSYATYDRGEYSEKIAHDECSHLAQALRYAVSTRPTSGDVPESEKPKLTSQVLEQAGRDAMLIRMNARHGLVPKRGYEGQVLAEGEVIDGPVVRDQDGNIVFVQGRAAGQMRRPYGA